MTALVLSCLAGTLTAAACFAVWAVEGHKSPFLPLSVGIAVAALTLLLAPPTVPVGFAIWSLIMFGGLTALGATDSLTKTVPDLISVPMVALGLVHAATMGQLWPFGLSVAIVLVFAILWAALAPQRLSSLIGGGDVLLLAVALAWVGPGVLPDLIVLTAAILIAQVAVMRAIGIASVSDPSERPENAVPLAAAIGLAQGILWVAGPLL
ncbi:MAG: prepilin peptidase [Pseudomonadota bacterium]